jgi:hypothetical protein
MIAISEPETVTSKSSSFLYYHFKCYQNDYCSFPLYYSYINIYKKIICLLIKSKLT